MKAIALSGFPGSAGHTCCEEQIEIQWKEQRMLIEAGYGVEVIMGAAKVVAAACELIEHLKGDHEEARTTVENPTEK